MTVDELSHIVEGNPEEYLIICTWFDSNGKVQSYEFRAEMLEDVSG